MSGFPSDDNVTAWIAELRAHLDRGDLAALGPIDLGYGPPALPAEHAIRIMLTDLDDLEGMTSEEANGPVNVARRARLLADFRALQLLID